MNKELRIKHKFIIHHSSFIIRKPEGFTFVEILVVLAVLMVTGAVVGVILFSTLKGATKTNTLSVVRQNGNYAIAQMSKTIRNAKQFNGVSINNDQNVPYTTDCTASDSTPYKYLKITDTNDQSVVYSCETTTTSGIISIRTSLLDANSVVVNSCSFICTQINFGDNPTIGINFSLSQKQAPGTTPLSDNQATVQFSTSINTRNLAR